MSEKPNIFFRFFTEMQRRKVFRVMAMYAGFAYIAIELTSNLTDPLHLPTWFGTVVVLLEVNGLIRCTVWKRACFVK